MPIDIISNRFELIFQEKDMLFNATKGAVLFVIMCAMALGSLAAPQELVPSTRKGSTTKDKGEALKPVYGGQEVKKSAAHISTDLPEPPDLDAPPSFQPIEETALLQPAPSLTLTIPAKNVRTNRALIQEGRIAALVNNDIISMTDIQYRLRLQTRGQLASLPKEQRDKVTQDILRTIIDENIKLQATKMMGIIVDDAQVKDHLQLIEKQHKLPAGKFIMDTRHLGVPLYTLYNQVRADLAWSTFIQELYKQTRQLHKHDIRATLRKDISTTPQYHLAEIVVYTDGPESVTRAQEILQKAINSLKKGMPFPQAAFQYSESPSMVNGGNIGWVHQDMLESEVAEVLERLTPGQISSMPIETPEALKIILLIDKKGPSVQHPIITARQLNVKLSDEVINNADLLQKETNRLNELVATVNSCGDFDQLSDQIPNAESHIYQDMRLLDLTPDLKNVLETLEVGQASHGIFNATSKTLSFFLICRKEMVDSNKIAYMENQENEMLQQRLNALSDQKLRDFRRTAAIDIRM